MQELTTSQSGLSFQGNVSQTGAGSSAQRERQVNQPPPPIRPVSGGGYVSTGAYNDNMSMADYNNLPVSGWGSKGRR